MKIQLIVALTLGAMLVSGENAYIQVCGRNLAQILENLCVDPKLEYKRAQVNGLEQDGSWPWIVSSHAKALGGARGKRPVATECCLKACSLSELLSYC